MIDAAVRAFRLPDLRRKILFTFGLLWLAEHLAMDLVQLRLPVLDRAGGALDVLPGDGDVATSFVDLERTFLAACRRQLSEDEKQYWFFQPIRQPAVPNVRQLSCQRGPRSCRRSTTVPCHY